MDCAEEVSVLRARLSRVRGVRELRFDVVAGRMEVEYSAEQTSGAAIEAAVTSAGMRCEAWRAGERSEAGRERWRAALAWVSGVALACGLGWQAWVSGEVVETLLAHGHAEHGGGHGHEMHPVALGLLLVAIAGGLVPVLPKAWASLRARRADMHLLVAISLAGASWLGEWAEAATLSFLFALAGRLESWSVGRAREAISELLAGVPSRVAVLHGGTHHGQDDAGEHEHLVEAAAVEPGTLVRVRPGERIAFDGIVVGGRSEVNQAFVTGESVPVEKREGEAVYAGTLNVSGSLDVRTTRAASDTMLARTIRMAGESWTRRAPSERFVEQFTRVYTPVILALAGLVTLAPPLLRGGDWDYWLYQGMVVLLIACPCALVISTPVCVVAAITAAARRQVLIKGGSVLEASARIRALAMDKTAALLAGMPKVERIVPLGAKSEREVLESLAALERSSEHPIAKAILREAESRGIFVTASAGFTASANLAVETAEGGVRFWAGSPARLEERNEGAGAALKEAARLAAEGMTVVVCGADRGEGAEPWALVALSQPLCESAGREIASLGGRGVERVVLLTGDLRESALAAARGAGIQETHALLRPQEKTAHVAALIARHREVAFLGDSVHDAEAIGVAPVGIAMGPHAADVAREAAGVIILPQDLGRLGFLIDHGRRALGVIRQNVWLAVGAKVLFLAAAMTGSATLWMAVAADMGATLLVTLNGLRLLDAGRHPTD